MNFLICPDSFKGSLTAFEATDIIERALQAVNPAWRCESLPLADGGEGSVEVYSALGAGEFVETEVEDPLGRPIEASYAYNETDKTAVIEMAKASGLPLLNENERNPLITHSYGCGQLIAHALDRGAQNIILAIGGSATNDAGCGMAAALGVVFYDKNQQAFIPAGGDLASIAKIDMNNMHPKLSSCRFQVACDVENPLYGDGGAARVYGPQKGADEQMVEELDAGLKTFADFIQQHYKRDLQGLSGGGAAGGLGAGSAFFLQAELKPGLDLFLNLLAFDEKLANTDYLISGEGRLDKQSFSGKVIGGLLKRCREKKVPMAALCGGHLLTVEERLDCGLDYLGVLPTGPLSLEACQAKAGELLYLAAVEFALSLNKGF